jgi:hypothetical protein
LANGNSPSEGTFKGAMSLRTENNLSICHFKFFLELFCVHKQLSSCPVSSAEAI